MTCVQIQTSVLVAVCRVTKCQKAIAPVRESCSIAAHASANLIARQKPGIVIEAHKIILCGNYSSNDCARPCTRRIASSNPLYSWKTLCHFLRCIARSIVNHRYPRTQHPSATTPTRWIRQNTRSISRSNTDPTVQSFIVV